ncbi:hypothetical protein PAXRUDRAFT_170484, partial [Paxillus rubicundulus Ve08.2h10]
HILRPPTPLLIAMPQPTHLTNLPHRQGQLKVAPIKVSRPDAMEMVQGDWGSVPEPPGTRTRTQGMEAHTSIPPAHPHTVNYHIR